MNRSIERTRFPVAATVRRELVVASVFVHPRRGRVQCPAARLLAHQLSRQGWRVRLAALGGNVGDGDGVALFAGSYLDGSGQAVGVGVAARTDDLPACVAAERAVTRWSELLRTRRVLLTAFPYELSREWHGGGRSRGSVVERTRSRVAEYLARGHTVLVIGSRAHGDSLLGPDPFADTSTIVVESTSQVEQLRELDPERVSFVVAPGMPVEDAVKVLAALRVRFPLLRGQHPNEFCYQASDRKETLDSIAAASDLLVVCGQFDDPEARELLDWGGSLVARTQRLSDAMRLRLDWLRSAATVGVAMTGSASSHLVEKVVGAVAGFGPLSVVRRGVVTEHVDVALWSQSQYSPCEEHHDMPLAG